MISNENTQRLSTLPSNYITFENNSSDNSSITIYSNYNSNKEFSFLEDIFDNEIDNYRENNLWRIDYFSFIESEINKIRLSLFKFK